MQIGTFCVVEWSDNTPVEKHPMIRTYNFETGFVSLLALDLLICLTMTNILAYQRVAAAEVEAHNCLSSVFHLLKSIAVPWNHDTKSRTFWEAFLFEGRSFFYILNILNIFYSP